MVLQCPAAPGRPRAAPRGDHRGAASSRLGRGRRAHLHLRHAVRPFRSVTNRMSSPAGHGPCPAPSSVSSSLANTSARLSVSPRGADCLSSPHGREPSWSRGRCRGPGGQRSRQAQDARCGRHKPSSAPRAGLAPPPPPLLPLGPGSRPGTLRSRAAARAEAGGQRPRMLLEAPRRERDRSGADGDSARSGAWTRRRRRRRLRLAGLPAPAPAPAPARAARSVTAPGGSARSEPEREGGPKEGGVSE